MSEPSDYLRALRDRWWILALALLLAVVAVLATTPDRSTSKKFEAAHTISLIPSRLPPAVSVGAKANFTQETLKAAARLFRGPELAVRVAEEIEFEGEPAKLAQGVAIAAKQKVGGIVFTAKSGDRASAALRADAFGREAVEYHQAVEQEAYESEVQRIEDRVEALTSALGQTTGGVAASPAQVSTREGLSRQLEVAVGRRAELDSQGFPLERFTTGPAAVARVAKAGAGLQAPEGRLGRLGLGAALALALGAALALVMDRFDTRVRTKAVAEHAFGLPVLTEVPLANKQKGEKPSIETVTRPRSAVAEAFHRLRSSILVAPAVARIRPAPSGADNGAEAVSGRPVKAHRYELAFDTSDTSADRGQVEIVLVTSPGVGDGRTTTVANLAASVAETDQPVLVVDCDLRHPALHRIFGVGEGPGVSDVTLETRSASSLSDVSRATSVPGVRIATSGDPVESPGRLMAEIRQALAACRGSGTLVIVDTPPALLVSDASDLIPAVDAVVVVARAGRTTADAASRMVELLARQGAPVLGVVLNGVSPQVDTDFANGNGDEDHGRNGRGRRTRVLSRRRVTSGEAPTPALQSQAP